MGCACSKEAKPAHASLSGVQSTAQALLREKRTVHAGHRRKGKILKVLVTGTEQTGKSTLCRYMKISLAGGLEAEESAVLRHHLHANLLDSILCILAAMKGLDMSVASDTLAERCKDLPPVLLGTDSELDGDTLALIEELWRDGAVQRCYHNKSRQLGLSDGAGYLLDNIERYKSDDFEPTDSDLLHIHTKHAESNEVGFNYWKYEYMAHDFSNRQPLTEFVFSKFSNVEFTVFCVSLADYDIVDSPSESADGVGGNRLLKSLTLFESHCKGSFFNKTFVWLVLNKTDVFRSKLANTPLTVCFPDYKGRDPPAACNFIKEKFRAVHPKGSDLFVHVMSATDTEATDKFKKAFERASEARSLAEYGLLAR